VAAVQWRDLGRSWRLYRLRRLLPRRTLWSQRLLCAAAATEGSLAAEEDAANPVAPVPLLDFTAASARANISVTRSALWKCERLSGELCGIRAITHLLGTPVRRQAVPAPGKQTIQNFSGPSRSHDGRGPWCDAEGESEKHRGSAVNEIASFLRVTGKLKNVGGAILTITAVQSS